MDGRLHLAPESASTYNQTTCFTVSDTESCCFQHLEGWSGRVYMQEDTFQLQSQSGEDLYLRVWKPTGIAESAGAVIISHGLGEHCGRYTHVARHFTRHGFSVYGADHVDFGRSGGRRGHVPGGIETCGRCSIWLPQRPGKGVGRSSWDIPWAGFSCSRTFSIIPIWSAQPSFLVRLLMPGTARVPSKKPWSIY